MEIKNRIKNLDAHIESGFNYAVHLTSCMGAIDEVHFFETLEKARAYFFKRLSAVSACLEHTDGLIMSVYHTFHLKRKEAPRAIYAMSFDQAFLNN